MMQLELGMELYGSGKVFDQNWFRRFINKGFPSGKNWIHGQRSLLFGVLDSFGGSICNCDLGEV